MYRNTEISTMIYCIVTRLKFNTDNNVIQQKCIDKEDKVYRGNNQVVNLTTNYIWSGCIKKEKLSMMQLDCNGKNMFQSLKGARSQ